MKILMTAIALATILGPASAQETKVDKDIVWRQPVIPSEEEKKAALLIALKLRGGFNGGFGGMVDLTDPRVLAEYDRIMAAETPARHALPPTVRTVEVKPNPVPRPDICQRHGKRKVVTGNSWRCR